MAAVFTIGGVIMKSVRNARSRVSLTPSPSKSPSRRFTTTSTSNPPSQKRHIVTRKNIKKSQSENSLVTQFRSLSLTPNPKPPNGRPRSLSAKKTRSFSNVTTKNIVDIVNLIKEERCKNIVIMAGAGISTPSGIPDFRTPGTGLYDNLQEYNIPEPTAIFDIEYFWYDPRPFFCLAKELYPGNFQPNYVHHFIKLLHDKGLLLRMYTQNIDGLERLVGIPSDKLVEAHGTFSSASCIRCHKTYDGDSIKNIILKGKVPRCQAPKCQGIIKPDIVFFGEDLPKKFYQFEVDFPNSDLVIVMGTSLEVQPFAGIVSEAGRSTPRLLINREVVGPFASPWGGRRNDVVLKGDIVTGVKRLVKLLDWTEEMLQRVTEANENWKNEKLAEGEEREKERSELKESQQNGNVNGTQKRGYHTVAQTTQKLTPNRTLYPIRTGLRTSEKMDVGSLSNLGKTVADPLKNSRKDGSLSVNGCPLPGNNTRLSRNNPSLPGNNPLLAGDCSSRKDSTTKVSPPNMNKHINKQSLFACNSVARRAPLLPFRYTHKNNLEQSTGSYRSIDPKSELASAGFGLGNAKDNKAEFYVDSSSDSDSSSSSSSDSEG